MGDKQAHNNLKMISKTDKPKNKKKINPSFPKRTNSVMTMRSLQASNRSLALSLEKMRQEFKLTRKNLTKLKEMNSKLTEEVSELKQIGVPDNLIENEVNKICKERLGNVRKKLFTLNNLATEFVDTLTDLSEICFSGNFQETDSVSPITSPCSTPAVKRGTDGASFVSGHTEYRREFEVTDDMLKPCTSIRNPKILERSCNKEQSSLNSSDEESSDFSGQTFETSNSDSSASVVLKKQNSHSNFNVYRQSRELNKLKHDSIQKAVPKFNQTTVTDSSQKAQFQETFNTSSDGFPKSDVIADIIRRQFKLRDHHDREDEWVGTDTQSPRQVSSDLGLLPSSSVEKKTNNKLGFQRRYIPKVRSSSSLEELHVLTFEMPRELYKPHTAPNKIAKQKKISPLKKTYSHKHNFNNVVKADVNKADHFTANEFDLVNAQGQSLENSVNNASYITTVHRCFPYEVGKRSSLPKDGREYLNDEENDVIEHAGIYSKALPVGSKIKADMLKACTIRKNKQKEHNVYDAEGERFLDAIPNECKVLMESTEDCKYRPASCHKTISKPKKVKAGKRKNLLLRNPQLGFDCKDKSHTLLNEKRQRVKPMIDLSTDQFSLSPPMYLNKNRPRSKNTKKVTKRHSSAESGQTNNSNTKKRAHILLTKDSRQEVLFEDNIPATDFNYQTKLLSHYRKQNQCESNKRSVRKHILSTLKWIQSKTHATSFKIDGWEKPEVDDSLELTESASETITLCNKPVDSLELLNKDARSTRDGNMNSHTQIKMSNFNYVESGANFKTKTTQGHSIPVEDITVSASMLGFETETRIHSHRLEKEQDLLSLSLSLSDINAKACGLLPQSFPAVEVTKLNEERDTNESLVLLNSNTDNFGNKKEIAKLMNDIKHSGLSNTSSHLKANMTILEETSNKEYECTESLYLACISSDDEFEGTSTV